MGEGATQFRDFCLGPRFSFGALLGGGRAGKALPVGNVGIELEEERMLLPEFEELVLGLPTVAFKGGNLSLGVELGLSDEAVELLDEFLFFVEERRDLEVAGPEFLLGGWRGIVRDGFLGLTSGKEKKESSGKEPSHGREEITGGT